MNRGAMAGPLRSEMTRVPMPTKSSGLKFTFGEKTLIIYFVAYYFIPMSINFFIDIPIKYKLGGDLPFFIPFLFSIVFLLLLLFLRKAINLSVVIKVPLQSVITSRAVIYLVFATYFVFAFQFGLEFSSSFRHQQSYSEAGIVPIVTFSFKMIGAVYVFASLSDKKLVSLNWVHYSLFLSALFFSFASSNDFIYGAMCIYAWVRASGAGMIRLLRRSFGKFGFVIPILLVPSVVFAGMLNKLGYEGAVAYFSDGWFTTGLELFANRSFYHSYSLAYHLSHLDDTFALFGQVYEIISFQIERRLVVLFGGSMPNETLQTVSRLNYLLISGYNLRSDAGASPGMLGSMFFLPGSIYALPFHLFLIYNIVSMFDYIMGKAKYNLVAYFGALALLQALTDSLLDKLNPIGVGFITVFMFVTISSHARNIPDPACLKKLALLRHRH